MSDPESALLKPTLIFLGSGAGGLLRYWLGSAVQNRWGTSFPAGTLLVNVTGCFLMGVLVAAWANPAAIREEIRVAILVGLLGGYTTFSSFGRDTLSLIHSGDWTRAAIYVVGSVGLSLAAVFLGAALAGKVSGT